MPKTAAPTLPPDVAEVYVLVPRAELDEILSFVRDLRPLVEQFAGLGAKLAAGGPAALFGMLRPGP